jgi:hypothetical protein
VNDPGDDSRIMDIGTDEISPPLEGPSLPLPPIKKNNLPTMDETHADSVAGGDVILSPK